MVLTLPDNQVIVLHDSGFQLPVLSRCQGMVENTDIVKTEVYTKNNSAH